MGLQLLPLGWGLSHPFHAFCAPEQGPCSLVKLLGYFLASNIHLALLFHAIDSWVGLSLVASRILTWQNGLDPHWCMSAQCEAKAFVAFINSHRPAGRKKTNVASEHNKRWAFVSFPSPTGAPLSGYLLRCSPSPFDAFQRDTAC